LIADLIRGLPMAEADIGVVGLGVMGRMIALNMERSGFEVAVYNRTIEKMHSLITEYPNKHLIGSENLDDFVASIKKPRRIMMMVSAGKGVDAVIAEIKTRLDPGDLLIDGGNTHFIDTERHERELDERGILFMGAGVSGGEYGALWGPSIMPGGSKIGWELIQPIFEAIAAKVQSEPCVAYMGPRGAGHYVKMVHNGIEYGDMQLIAEAYDLLYKGLGLSTDELHNIFLDWNEGELESFLIKITGEIFAKLDDETGLPLVDLILDEAKQKGTGQWNSQNALDLGSPTPTINAAVEARFLSSLKEERVQASSILAGPEMKMSSNKDEFITAMRDALYAAKICSYAQGFSLMSIASKEYKYGLNLSEIARIWRGGCIIRARFLEDIRMSYHQDPNLQNLLLDPAFGRVIVQRQDALRKVVMLGVQHGIPLPGFSSALAYYDAYRRARLPSNLTQAQRDYFGAHTYRRIDKEGTFHTDWMDINQAPS
jgi:6-phosphogluconate dehydrogenase